MTWNLKPLAQEHGWNTLVTLSKALPQGIILVGPAGVGKRRAAKALFQLLSCKAGPVEQEESTGGLFAPTTEPALAPARPQSELPCGECASCRKIAEDKHPDYLELKPKGETIPVEDLREMKKSLYFAPLESKYRFVVIDQAHKLGAASANTLLKTLEEPPAHTRFFLITHERGLLLPTVTSRCQFVHFAPLDEETLRLLLVQQGFDIPERVMETCLKLLSGGLEKAALLADEKTLSFIDSTLRLIRTANSSSWEAVTQMADSLAGGAGGAEDWKLELLLDLLVLSRHDQALEYSKRPGHAGHAAALAAVNRAMEAAFLRRRLERYANRKLVALAAAELAAQ